MTFGIKYFMHDAGETKAAPRRIRFTPPTEMFTLCHYTASGLKGPPIKAVYDMKVTLFIYCNISISTSPQWRHNSPYVLILYCKLSNIHVIFLSFFGLELIHNNYGSFCKQVVILYISYRDKQSMSTNKRFICVQSSWHTFPIFITPR